MENNNMPPAPNAIVNPFAPGGAANPNGQIPAQQQFNFFGVEELQPIAVGRYVIVQMPNQPARSGIVTAVEGNNYTIRVIQNQEDVDHPNQVQNPVILEQVAREHLIEQPFQEGLMIGGELVPFQPMIIGAPAPALENLIQAAPNGGAEQAPFANLNHVIIPQENQQENPQGNPQENQQGNQQNNNQNAMSINSENEFQEPNFEGGLRRKRRTRGRKSRKSRRRNRK